MKVKLKQTTAFKVIAKQAQNYVDDYEYALEGLRCGTYQTYGVDIVRPPNGNIEAVEQAEKDFEYERRTNESIL